MRLGKEPKPYITCRPHGKYPAGTKCMASRPDDRELVLTFEDGTSLTMGLMHYAEGLEDPKTATTLQNIFDVEDKRFFDAIEAALKP